MTERRVNNSC